jgi:hypothetical protein
MPIPKMGLSQSRFCPRAAGSRARPEARGSALEPLRGEAEHRSDLGPAARDAPHEEEGSEPGYEEAREDGKHPRRFPERSAAPSGAGKEHLPGDQEDPDRHEDGPQPHAEEDEEPHGEEELLRRLEAEEDGDETRRAGDEPSREPERQELS